MRIGDWERDSMLISNRRHILVCTDRKSRFTKITPLESIKVKDVAQVTLALLKKTGRRVHTITNDNGPEFKHSPKLPVPVYFCDPRKPQQRGTVENTIGLIRQFIKRSTKFKQLTADDYTNMEESLNFRPRKCLDYKTPYEVFYNKSVAVVV